MSIPLPPTDSLYKFCAITGTIMLLVCTFYPMYLLDAVGEKIANSLLSNKIAKIESDMYADKIEKVGRLIDNSIAEQGGKFNSDTGRLILRYSDSEVKSMLNELDELKKSSALKQAESEFHIGRSRELLDQWWHILWWSILMIVISISILVYGYRNWYRKIQVHIDRAFAVYKIEVPKE